MQEERPKGLKVKASRGLHLPLPSGSPNRLPAGRQGREGGRNFVAMVDQERAEGSFIFFDFSSDILLSPV